MGQQVNQGELATFLGRSTNTIQTMVRKGCPYLQKPERSSGKGWLFDTAEVVEWLLANEGKAGGKSDKMAEAELLDKRAQAGLRQLEFAERQKVLVRADDYLRWVNEGVSIIKTRLLALPARVVQQVSAQSDPAINLVYLKSEVNDMLTAMSEHFAQRAAEQRALPDTPPPAPEPVAEAEAD